jgi:acyl homoserine lactone synthase
LLVCALIATVIHAQTVASMSKVQVFKADSPNAAPVILDEMYRLRYQVFKERMKWEIPGINGMDIDQFDTLGPLYAVYLDDTNAVLGSWRLLPTTGPYMIRDVFPELLGGAEPPAGPTTWEISRFSARPTDKAQSLAAVHPITSALLISLVQVCLRAGITQVVSASDLLFERILRKAGAVAHRLGPVCRIGSTRAVAGWIDISVDHLQDLVAASPLSNPLRILDIASLDYELDVYPGLLLDALVGSDVRVHSQAIAS